MQKKTYSVMSKIFTFYVWLRNSQQKHCVYSCFCILKAEMKHFYWVALGQEWKCQHKQKLSIAEVKHLYWFVIGQEWKCKHKNKLSMFNLYKKWFVKKTVFSFTLILFQLPSLPGSLLKYVNLYWVVLSQEWKCKQKQKLSIRTNCNAMFIFYHFMKISFFYS